jgi:hypothetical protein
MFCTPRLIFGGNEGVGSRILVLCSRTCFLRCRVRRVPFSCFVIPESFSSVPRATSSVFLSCAPVLVFGGTEGVGSRFHVLRSRSHFPLYRGRRITFSSFVLPDSFLAMQRALGPVFMICEPELVFCGTEGVESRCFARPDSFSAVPRASVPVFIFCAPGLVFGGAECVGSRINVLLARTHFRRYRGRRGPALIFMFCAPGLIFGGTEGIRVSFSCFALPDSFSAVLRASGPLFFFRAP